MRAELVTADANQSIIKRQLLHVDEKLTNLFQKQHLQN